MVKDVAHQIIDRLPDEASIDDIMHALYIHAKFEHGLRQIEQGQGIPHEEAKKRFGLLSVQGTREN
jgi:predicted transcriptional regulator